jgi:aspartate kinase
VTVAVIVQKFGGTSVATAEKILAAAQRAVDAKRRGADVVMVVSARGKKTDELVSLAAEVSETVQPREMDMLLSTGEQESVALVAMAIRKLGEPAVSLTGGQIGITTDSTFTKARIRAISTERMRAHLGRGAIVVACGFQGVDDEGNITTLGRGGSDTTATALAAALHADECEIYTDVEGVFTTDPRIVPAARKIERISYDEMLELASLGAGVMHSRSIEFAKKFRVLLRVRPAYSNDPGTLIAPEGGDVPKVVTGLAVVKNEARVSLRDLPDRPGVMSVIFGQMAAHKIPIDMVVQNVSKGETADVSFTVPESDLADTLTAAEAAIDQLGAGSVRTGTSLSKVSAVGVGMRTHSGVAAQMFRALAECNANIEMITTSDIKISTLIHRDKAREALEAVHRVFALESPSGAPPKVGWAQSVNGNGAKSDDETLRQVVSGLSGMEDIVVSEVRLDESQSLVSVTGLPDVPGVCSELFAAVAEGDIMVDTIVQNVSRQGHTVVSFTVPRRDHDQCLLLVHEVLSQWDGAACSSEREIDQLSVIGVGLRSHTGVGERMFRALAEADINVKMVNTSEIRMSAVVAADQGRAAHQALLSAFQLRANEAK